MLINTNEVEEKRQRIAVPFTSKPSMDQRIFFCLAALAVVLSSDFITIAGAQGVGVNYGMLGDNLPNPNQVISLYKSRNIQKLRLFAPDADVFQALEGSGIEVVLGTRNEDLQQLANDASFAANWVQTNIAPHAQGVRFRYIAAGNEVIPGDLAGYVLPAMQNLDAALKAANIPVPVTTAVSTGVLGVSYPPSQGAFSEWAGSIMAPIAAFLEANKSPLLVNVYPYFSYIGDPADIRLDYALFTAPGVVVWDNGLGYRNLFDAIVDAVYSALEKAGGPSVEIVVSETGWPSAENGDIATVENAGTYNNNAVAHAVSGNGSPKRPGRVIETYLFAMFNENMKPAGTEQHFGLFYPYMSEVYHVNFL